MYIYNRQSFSLSQKYILLGGKTFRVADQSEIRRKKTYPEKEAPDPDPTPKETIRIQNQVRPNKIKLSLFLPVCIVNSFIKLTRIIEHAGVILWSTNVARNYRFQRYFESGCLHRIRLRSGFYLFRNMESDLSKTTGLGPDPQPLG